MIHDDHELMRAFGLVARLVRQREQALQEPVWNESLRRMVADSVAAQQSKIEREIAEYLAAKRLIHAETEPAGVA